MSGKPCQSATCPNGFPPSHLECPTCNKLGIKGSFFCGQECFKSGWKSHKVVHNLIAAAAADANPCTEGAYNPFPNFSYTGTLRPCYPLSSKRQVPDHIQRPDYVSNGGVSRIEQRAYQRPTNEIHDKETIEKMRVACRISREVLDIAAAAVRPGITTNEIDEIVHNATIERNAYPSPLGYRGYPKSVCTSVNEVICHGIPDQRKLKEGDIINLDVSCYHDGFHGDVNATYPVGKVSKESASLIETSRACCYDSIAICKPGALFRDIGKVVEPIATKGGCSSVRTYTGHGINNKFHCPPDIPHYAKNKAVGAMKAGMIFTIEPMINKGSDWSADVHWPDNWTATTSDGMRSAQFEETILITEDGYELLTGAHVNTTAAKTAA